MIGTLFFAPFQQDLNLVGYSVLQVLSFVAENERGNIKQRQAGGYRYLLKSRSAGWTFDQFLMKRLENVDGGKKKCYNIFRG